MSSTDPHEIPPAEFLPLFLDIRNAATLVVGGGPVGERRVLTLLQYGARVTLVAPDATPLLTELADDGRIAWHPREAVAEDLDGIRLAVAATSHTAVNEAVQAWAAARGVLVCRADDGPAGSAIIPAIVRAGPVTLAVSTGGRAPALSRYLKDRLPALLGPEVEVLAEILASARSALREAGVPPASRTTCLRALMQSDIPPLAATGRAAEARALAKQFLADFLAIPPTIRD